ncbi:hypothetical protein [Celeribacter halophilus]|uniref:hypothetical protein n=1 Tax=Celeribacter halophilus TaxID=576117 RepID=UPI003A92571B
MTGPAASKLTTSTSFVEWKDDLPIYQRMQNGVLGETNPVSVFGDDTWIMHHLSGKPTSTKRNLAFHNFPEQWTATVKRIAWCMLNIDTPVTLIQRPNATRTRLSPGSVVSNFEAEIWPFIRWLCDNGFENLLAVDERALREYGDQVAASTLSREYKSRRLWGPTRFWLYAPYLPRSDQLIQPPWEVEGTQDLLGPANWSGENKTPPIHPQTMSPLLTWAITFVTDFSETILEAVDQRNCLRGKLREKPKLGDKERLDQFLGEFKKEWGGLPGVQTRSKFGIAAQYISVMADVGINLVKTEVSKRIKSGAELIPNAALISEPSLFIEGRALRPFIDYYEVEQLKQLLATACIVVIAYLSGMRSEECRGLQRGCCRRISIPNGSYRYEIIAKSYKDALDAEGNTIHGGAFREDPWHVIRPVAEAIFVMEQLHSKEYLFSEEALQSRKKNNDKGLVLMGTAISHQLKLFVAWCNQEAKRAGFPKLQILDDPAGPISMRRFRRTLAWFIYRQPAGRISLGIQYGHLQGMTSDGYGSRVSTGLRDLFPMEEAFARAELLTEAAERLSGGESVSGPSAKRYVAGVQEFQSRFQGKYLTSRQAAELCRDPVFRIFDNGIQPVACCYDSANALCHPDRETKTETTPNLSRCDPQCPNVARTDSHVFNLRQEIEWQELQAKSPLTPEPLRFRHMQRVAKLTEFIDKHENEKRRKGPSDA